jgi:hypothetical protein
MVLQQVPWILHWNYCLLESLIYLLLPKDKWHARSGYEADSNRGYNQEISAIFGLGHKRSSEAPTSSSQGS